MKVMIVKELMTGDVSPVAMFKIYISLIIVEHTMNADFSNVSKVTGPQVPRSLWNKQGGPRPSLSSS